MGIIALIGSTALILFAIRFLRKGLDRLLGTRLGVLAAGMARTPARGFLAGGAMAAIAPSSTSMATVVSRLSLEERIDPPTALALMLGTNVGLTSLVLLGAAGLESGYPIVLIIGVALFQFTRSETSRGFGQIVLALGFVFLGLHLTKQAIPELRGGDADILLAMASHHVLVLAAASCVLTILVQSSSVTILLLMCLADQHTFGLDAVLAAVAGANLGLIGTALAIAWKDRRSRLIAFGNATFKGGVSVTALVTSAIATPWLQPITGNAHVAAGTHLCLAMAAAGLGLVCGPAVLVRLGQMSLLRQESDELVSTRYLGLEVGDDTQLAMANSRREILHVSEKARAMLDQVWRAWRDGDRLQAKVVARLDDQIDLLDREIKSYLVRVGGRDDPAIEQECLCQLRYVTQLEAIGDVIEKQLADLVAKGIRHSGHMSPECRCRLDSTCQGVLRTLLTAETAFATRDPVLAQRLLEAKATVANFWRSECDSSLERRRAGIPHEAEAIYLDMLSCLERINRGACAFAHDVVRMSGSGDSSRLATTTACA